MCGKGPCPQDEAIAANLDQAKTNAEEETYTKILIMSPKPGR